MHKWHCPYFPMQCLNDIKIIVEPSNDRDWCIWSKAFNPLKEEKLYLKWIDTIHCLPVVTNWFAIFVFHRHLPYFSILVKCSSLVWVHQLCLPHYKMIREAVSVQSRQIEDSIRMEGTELVDEFTRNTISTQEIWW